MFSFFRLKAPQLYSGMIQVVGMSSQKQVPTNGSFLFQRGLTSNNQPVFILCPHSNAWQPIKKFHTETRHWLG